MTETNLAAMELAGSSKQDKTIREVVELDLLIDQINHVCDVIDTSIDPIIQRMQTLSIEPEEW